MVQVAYQVVQVVPGGSGGALVSSSLILSPPICHRAASSPSMHSV